MLVEGDHCRGRRRRASARALALAAGVALLLGMPASPAFGHAAFLGSDPEPGAFLESAPGAVVLTFSEPLDDSLSGAALVLVDGDREVPAQARAESGRRLVVRPREELGRGPYRVEWHSVSTRDGHTLAGSFSFGVEVRAAGGEHTVQQSPLARGGWLRILARAVMYATLLAFVGALVLRGLLGHRAKGSWLVPSGLRGRADELDGDRVAARERVLVTDLGLLAAGAAAAAALVEGADAAGGLSPAGLRDYLLSNVAGLGRAATVVLVVLAGWLAVRGARAAMVPAVLALGAVAASGHAASATPRVTTIAIDWVHLLAAAAWLGGIALIVVTWGPALHRGGVDGRLAIARQVLPAFGRVALPAFVLVVVTGLVSAVVQLGHPAALWSTAYGRVLLAKMGLVALIAMASYLHAFRLRPRLLNTGSPPPARSERRHWRLLRAEPLVGAGVVLAVAALATFPLPPRELGEGGEAQAAALACDPCPQPLPAAGELAVAEQAGSGLVAAWIRRTPEGLDGELRTFDVLGKPSDVAVAVAGGRQERIGPGRWSFTHRGAAATLRVSVGEGRGRRVIELPARWRKGESAWGRRLLERAQATMRRLDSVRETERVTSGIGPGVVTQYRLRAPDRMALRTDAGAGTVLIGRREWVRAPGDAWQRTTATAPFRMRSVFRWTPYAQIVRVLERREVDGRRIAQLALMEPGTPMWQRLAIDVDSGRVLRSRLIVPGYYMDRRFHAFNRPMRIRSPEVDRAR